MIGKWSGPFGGIAEIKKHQQFLPLGKSEQFMQHTGMETVYPA